jgi:hypothetical protein
VTVSFAGPALRVWIMALALGSFAAGIVVGIVLPEMFAAERRLETPQEDAHYLTDKYGLSAGQHRRLVMVFEEYHRIDLNILRSANPSQLHDDIRAERLLNSRKADQRVRFVLDEKQRALYDRDETILRPGASGSVGNQENR